MILLALALRDGGFAASSEVAPLSLQTHERGLDLVERFKFSIYDAMIIAAAQLANCTTLYSEDFQHGQIIDGLAICDPFREQ
ncbi:MAG: PIN domain-containing protein [Methylovirgula sp.]